MGQDDREVRVGISGMAQSDIEVLVPMDRVLEFSEKLAHALLHAKNNVVLMVGPTGGGKSVLAKAFASVSATPQAIFIEPDWKKVWASPPELTQLDVSRRKIAGLCFIDEPQQFLNLDEFLAVPGVPVVLLVQDLSHAKRCIGDKACDLPVVEIIPFRLMKVASDSVAPIAENVADEGPGGKALLH